jgi:plasmid stabilization system protein ParE
MPRVLFTPAARADLVAAIRWYGFNAPHVVPHFRDALRTAVARIAENPKQFPASPANTRRALLRRFPYIVVFRETSQAVYVVAVFHTHRDPLTWQRRS